MPAKGMFYIYIRELLTLAEHSMQPCAVSDMMLLNILSKVSKSVCIIINAYTADMVYILIVSKNCRIFNGLLLRWVYKDLGNFIALKS